jgi:ESX secretion-associated protein EspI
MLGEVSYFSRFFVKFVEIIGAGLASAVCAYMLAHFGGVLLSSPTPAPAPALTATQLGPPPSEPAKSQPVQPPTPVAAAAVDAQRPAPQQDIDAAVAQPSVRSVKEVKTLPPRKHTKTDTSVAEKKPPGHKSAEALARAALANVDANRSAPIDVQPRQADVPTRGADVRSRRVGVPSRDAAIEAAPHAANVQPQLVQPRTVDTQPRPVAGPLPPSAGPPLENATPQPTHPAERDNGVFFALKRMRSDPPAPPGEAPRPPMPVGTPPPE